MSDKFDNEMLSAYFDGEVSAEEAARIEEELARSPERAKAFEDMQSLRSAIRAMPKRKAPSGMQANIMAAISEQAASGVKESQNDRIATKIDDKPSISSGEFSMRGWRWAISSIAAVAALVLFSLVITPPDRTGENSGLAVADSEPRIDDERSAARRKGQLNAAQTPGSNIDSFGGDIKQEDGSLGLADGQSAQFAIPGDNDSQQDLMNTRGIRSQTDSEDSRQQNGAAGEGNEGDADFDREVSGGIANNLSASGGRSNRPEDSASVDDPSSDSRAIDPNSANRNRDGGNTPSPRGGGGPGLARGGYGDTSSTEQVRGYGGTSGSDGQGQSIGGSNNAGGGFGGGGAGGGGFGQAPGQAPGQGSANGNEQSPNSNGRRFASGDGGQGSESGFENGEGRADSDGQLGQHDDASGSQTGRTREQSRYLSEGQRGLGGESTRDNVQELGTFVAVVELDLLEGFHSLDTTKEGELYSDPSNESVPSSGENQTGGIGGQQADFGSTERMQQRTQQLADDIASEREESLAETSTEERQQWELAKAESLDEILIDNGILELKLSDRSNLDDHAALVFNYDMMRYEIETRNRLRGVESEYRALQMQQELARAEPMRSGSRLPEEEDSDSVNGPGGSSSSRSVQDPTAVESLNENDSDDAVPSPDLHQSSLANESIVEQFTPQTEFFAYEYIEIEADAAAINGLLQDLAANGTNVEMFYTQSDHLFGHNSASPRLSRGRSSDPQDAMEGSQLGSEPNEMGQDIAQQDRRLEDEEAELAGDENNRSANTSGGESGGVADAEDIASSGGGDDDESGFRGSEEDRSLQQSPSRESLSINEQLASKNFDSPQLGREDFILVPFDQEYLKRRVIGRELRLESTRQALESKVTPNAETLNTNPSQGNGGEDASSGQAANEGGAIGDSVDKNNTEDYNANDNNTGDEGNQNAGDDGAAHDDAPQTDGLLANDYEFSDESRAAGDGAFEKSMNDDGRFNFYRRTHQFIQPTTTFGRKSIDDSDKDDLGFDMGWGIKGVLDRFSIENLSKQNEAFARNGHGNSDADNSRNGVGQPDEYTQPGIRRGGNGGVEVERGIAPQLIPQFRRDGRVRLTLIVKKRLTAPSVDQPTPASPAAPEAAPNQ